MTNKKKETVVVDDNKVVNEELTKLPTVNVADSEELVPISEAVQGEVIDGLADEMQPRRPKAMTDDEDKSLKAKVDEWLEMVKEDPASLKISSDIYRLGTESAQEVLPHTALYDTMIADIMTDNQKGPVEGTREYNVLELKKHMDLVNPAVLAQQPILVKGVLWLKKKQLPGADKVLDIIYENRETVKSAVSGLKLALNENANDLDKKLADLIIIYNGMRSADRMLKDDIYFGQLLHVGVHKYLQSMDDGLGKQNIETVLADLTTQVNNLLVEENMYVQFFAGSQQTAKMVRYQQNNLKTMVRLMERAVLANLGLKVVASSLSKSVDMTQAMGDTIAQTMKDTGLTTEKTAGKLRDARTKGNINLDKLKEGMEALVRTYEAEAQANKEIIEKGVAVSKEVKAMTDKLSSHIDQSENAMNNI